MVVKKDYLVSFFLGVGLILLYIHNLSRSIYAGDVGDFVTAAYVKGVPHPPGYPLFTLLGFFLTHLPFSQAPAYMVGLISVFSSVFGVIFFYCLIKLLTKKTMLALISALILAFSYYFWFYSEIAEVFALNIFFVILLLFLAFCYRKRQDTKILLVLSLVTGLSLTNHQTILLIFPSLLVLLFSPLKKTLFPFSKQKFFLLITCLIVLMLGLAVYAYVPLAALSNPVINWDHVHDIRSFFQLILRQDYGTFNAGIFSGPSLLQRIIILKTYVLSLILQLTLPVIFLAIIGVFVLWKKYKDICVALLLGFLVSGPIFITYAGFPIYGPFFGGVYERFFIMSTIFLLIFAPFGLEAIAIFLATIMQNKRWIVWFETVFLIIPLMLFIYNFPKTDISNVFIGDNLGYDFLNPLPHNAILFVNGDTALFNVWYVHYVLHVRPDIKIININSLGGDEYFSRKLAQVRKTYPKNTEVENVTTVIKELNLSYPIFSVEMLNLSNIKETSWIPYGLTFELAKPDAGLPQKEFFYQQSNRVWNMLHIPIAKDKTVALGNLSIADIPNYYANALLAQGNYVLSNYKDATIGAYWVTKSLSVDPNYAKAHEVLGLYYVTFEKNCTLAANHLSQAISQDPFQKISYFLLYATYKDCLKDPASAAAVAQLFNKNLQLNFFNELNKTVNSSQR